MSNYSELQIFLFGVSWGLTIGGFVYLAHKFVRHHRLKYLHTRYAFPVTLILDSPALIFVLSLGIYYTARYLI